MSLTLHLTHCFCLFLELQSLEQQLEEAQTENFNIKQMKDLFEQKAAQLATEIAGMLNLIFFKPINNPYYHLSIICPRKTIEYFKCSETFVVDYGSDK